MNGDTDEKSEAQANSWSEWRQYILAEIKRLNGNLEKLAEHNAEMALEFAVEIAKLKMQAALIGGTAGLFAGIVVAWVFSIIFRG